MQIHELDTYAGSLGAGDFFAIDDGSNTAKVSASLLTTKVLTAVLDSIRPVGSTFKTVDKDFNPNTAWGGTWQLLPEGTILLAGSTSGTYKVGADSQTGSGYKEYGENSHTLTANEIPSHTHGNKSLSGSFKARRYGSSGTGAQIVYTPTGSVSISTDTTELGRINVAGQTGGISDVVTINASHEHDSYGGGQPHNLMQKSIAVYVWIRTA